MKDKKEKRYFCDWFWTHIMYDDDISIGGERIITPQSKIREYQKWNSRLEKCGEVIVCIITILLGSGLCYFVFGFNELFEIENIIPNIIVYIMTVPIVVVIGMIAYKILWIIGLFLMFVIAEISEKRKRKARKNTNQIEYKEYRKKRKKYLKTKRRGKRR